MFNTTSLWAKLPAVKDTHLRLHLRLMQMLYNRVCKQDVVGFLEESSSHPPGYPFLAFDRTKYLCELDLPETLILIERMPDQAGLLLKDVFTKDCDCIRMFNQIIGSGLEITRDEFGDYIFLSIVFTGKESVAYVPNAEPSFMTQVLASLDKMTSVKADWGLLHPYWQNPDIDNESLATLEQGGDMTDEMVKKMIENRFNRTKIDPGPSSDGTSFPCDDAECTGIKGESDFCRDCCKKFIKTTKFVSTSSGKVEVHNHSVSHTLMSTSIGTTWVRGSIHCSQRCDYHNIEWIVE